VRIDVVSIFPAYFAALEVSLLGKARASGLLDITIHDLRDWTEDPHRSVDDAPYGGGPGMLMRPEPWGRALDAVTGPDSLLIVPTPSGRRFTHADAREWSGRSHLVFGCGRYEGIDARVVEDAARRSPVEEVSIGDYVLAGGEAAVLVIVEAVARLLPGFMGNLESSVDDSFSDAIGLLEAPAYTRPPRWRDLDVPPVLLSGDHAAVAEWRRAESLRRTRERRPDLADDLPPRGPDVAQ
jgi:tRNA (guanine37-N1)-methyltransferase